MRKIKKPQPSEYPAYSHIYMDLLEDDDSVLEHLNKNFEIIKEYIYSLPEELFYYRYKPGKWSIKEILVHIVDDERIFCDRALRYARNDKTALPGFEQDSYAVESKANERNLDGIFQEYYAVRMSTIQLFEHLPEESFDRTGWGIDENDQIVNKRTVRALAYHIAGHELRHFNIIKERYVQPSLFVHND